MKGKQWLWIVLPVGIVIGLIIYTLFSTKGPHPGEVAYINHCASCHGNDGEGVGALIPPVKNSSFIQENPDQLACIIYHGIQGEIEVNGQIYDQPMLGLKGTITKMEVTNLINFLLQEWNGFEERQTPAEIEAYQQNCKFPVYSDSND
jgi:mono/diheme cytochrome c family protein